MARKWISGTLALLALAILGGCTTKPALGGFTTFQRASAVIGQPDFKTVGDNLTRSGLGALYGNPLLAAGKLFVPDYGQDRVLVFEGGIPSTSGAEADFVLGEPDFVSDDFGSAANQMYGPETLAAADGRLFVTEYDNNRVIVFNSIPTGNQPTADVVIGQAGFGTSAAACSATGMDSPESLFVHGGKLFVADAANNRVLIYDSLPTTNGAAPDVVLGQNDLTTCAANDDNQDGTADAGPTARTLQYPTDVWTDGTRLAVVDNENNRVLVWNAIPSTNFEPADLVLGQPNLTSNDSGSSTAADTMDGPYNLAFDNGLLAISDSNNNRVLLYDGFPETNGADADRVLGQGGFDTNTINDDNQDGTEDAAPTSRVLNYPTGLLLTETNLLVMDSDNSRVLVFRR